MKNKIIGIRVISSLSLLTKELINPTLAKQLQRKVKKTKKHLIQLIFTPKNPIIIPDKVIGKLQYPNKHIIWHMPILAPKNCPLKVIIRPPIQKIEKIRTKVELSLLSLDNDIANKKQKIRGPHKSQLYSSSILWEEKRGVITCFNLL